jgi:hypothetical protein
MRLLALEEVAAATLLGVVVFLGVGLQLGVVSGDRVGVSLLVGALPRSATATLTQAAGQSSAADPPGAVCCMLCS